MKRHPIPPCGASIPVCSIEFENFFSHHRGLVYAIALKLLRSSEDAKDVVQVVFAKVWAAPHSFRGGNIESWLATITRNASLDVLRKRVHDRALTSTCAERFRELTDTADLALGNLEALRLEQALEQLSEDARSLLIASFIARQPHRSIASSRALPIGTVKTRIRSGIAQLRRLLSAG